MSLNIIFSMDLDLDLDLSSQVKVPGLNCASQVYALKQLTMSFVFWLSRFRTSMKVYEAALLCTGKQQNGGTPFTSLSKIRFSLSPFLFVAGSKTRKVKKSNLLSQNSKIDTEPIKSKSSEVNLG